MRKTYIIIIIAALLLLSVFGGCNGEDNTTITKPITTTTTTSSTTAQVTEEPADIDVEYEYTGSETQGLIYLLRVEARTISQKVIIEGKIIQKRISIASVKIVAEFMDDSGAVIATTEDEFIIMGAYRVEDYDFKMTLGIEDPSLVKKCKLVITAREGKES